MDHQSMLLCWADRGQATSMAGFLCLPRWTNNAAFSHTALYLSLWDCHSKSSSSLASYSISSLNWDVVLLNWLHTRSDLQKWWIATVAMLINDIHEIKVCAATGLYYGNVCQSPYERWIVPKLGDMHFLYRLSGGDVFSEVAGMHFLEWRGGYF